MWNFKSGELSGRSGNPTFGFVFVFPFYNRRLLVTSAMKYEFTSIEYLIEAYSSYKNIKNYHESSPFYKSTIEY